MSRIRRLCYTGIAGIVLGLASVPSFALTTTYFATQAGYPNLIAPQPPQLTAGVDAQVRAFRAAMTVLGGNEFESNSTGFSYTGGTASLVNGTPTVINGDALMDLGQGRYNLTPGVTNNGEASYGHWLEATSDFTYQFSSSINAFAFFGTDFGDFDGIFSIDFRMGNTLVSSSMPISNPGANQNGNLVFYGLVSDQVFDNAVFHIQQAAGGGQTDVLGFDSFVVGSGNTVGPAPVPEPGSLALVGLALAALGATAGKARRARR